MIKKSVFWFYAIVGPAIVVFLTFGENFINGKLDATYAWFVLVPFIAISISLILIINHRLESLKSKSLRILTPGILYLLGITCVSLFIDFSLINVNAFIIVVFAYSVVIVGFTYLGILLYKKLVLENVNSTEVKQENLSESKIRILNFKSYVFKGFRFLIASVLIVIIPMFWLFTVTSFNTDIRFQYDKFAYTQVPTSEHLASLTADLLYSNHFEDRLIYFDLVLNDPNALKIIYSELETGEIVTPELFIPISEDELYDLVLLQYLNAYLYLGRYDDFKSKFILRFSEFKSFSYKYTYTIDFILVLNEDDPKIPVIIDTMNVLYQEIDGIDKESYMERIYNLRVQQYGYLIMGNSVKDQEVEKTVQEFFDQLIILQENQ